MNLLPLASEAFTALTDRDMLPSERREFVRTHRTCVFGYGRQGDGQAVVLAAGAEDRPHWALGRLRGVGAQGSALLEDLEFAHRKGRAQEAQVAGASAVFVEGGEERALRMSGDR